MSGHGKFRLACWNCGGAYSSFCYLKKLLQMTDVLAVSEHWLYRDSLSFLDSLDGNFECFARSSVLNDLNFRWRRGQGGVAFLSRRELAGQSLPGGNDRLVTITLKGTVNLVYVLCICPQAIDHCQIFKKTLEEIDDGAAVVIMGDFNAHLKVRRSSQTINAWGGIYYMLCL